MMMITRGITSAICASANVAGDMRLLSNDDGANDDDDGVASGAALVADEDDDGGGSCAASHIRICVLSSASPFVSFVRCIDQLTRVGPRNTTNKHCKSYLVERCQVVVQRACVQIDQCAYSRIESNRSCVHAPSSMTTFERLYRKADIACRPSPFGLSKQLSFR